MIKIYKESGGARPGAGRKKLTDKKKMVYVYVRESVITELGMDNIKQAMLEAINQAYEKVSGKAEVL